MIMKIALTIFAVLLVYKIIANIRANYLMTSDVPKKVRRKLMWRYGPFIMDDYVVHQEKMIHFGI